MQEQRSRRIITVATLASALGACAPGAATGASGGEDVRTPVQDGATSGEAGDAFVRAGGDDAAGEATSPGCELETCADAGSPGDRTDAGNRLVDVARTPTDGGGGAAIDADAGGAVAASDAGASCAPPRLLAPLSTATVSSSRPLLRWSASGDVTLEICADRACERVLASAEYGAPGAAGRADVALAPGTVYWRAFAGRGPARCAQASPVWQFRVPARDAPGDASSGTVPDFDGDGLADLAVGAEGAVAVYPGARGGVSSLPRGVVRPPARAPGEPPRTLAFGLHVESVGDTDGDGFADLAVGGAQGEVLVYRGGPAGPVPDAAAALHGGDDDAEFGKVSAAGDVNGDGYGDVLVISSNAESGGASHAYVFAGGPGGPSPSPAAVLTAPVGSRFALGVPGATAADFDGDGYGDVALAVSGSATRAAVLVYAGSPAGLSEAPRVAFVAAGEPAGALLALVSPGDADGDGFPDALAGVGGGADGVVLLRGGASGLGSAPAVHEGIAAGWSLRGGRDLNGDGAPDLLVSGAPLPGAVAVYLLGGAAPMTSTSLPDGASTGDSGSPTAPEGVGVDDVDGDGFADVVVRDEARGVVELYRSGARGPSGPPAVRLVPPDGVAAFGRAVAAACD